MAETTSETRELSREEFADYLRRLSEEFESNGEVDVEIGNKTVTLQPPTRIECETTVTEDSGGVMSDPNETFQMTVNWEPQG